MKASLAATIAAGTLAFVLAGCSDAGGPGGDASGAERLHLPMSFHVPAQVRGHAQVQGGQWAMLVFSPLTEADLLLASPHGGEATTHTAATFQAAEDPYVSGNAFRPIASSQAALPVPFQADVQLGAPRWSSLYLEAGSITFEATDTDSSLAVARKGSSPTRHLPGLPLGTSRTPTSQVRVDSVLLALEGSEARLPFRLQASDVTHALWYNATVACPSAGSCPDEPAYESTAVPGRRDHVDVRRYTQLDLPGGDLHGGGSAYAAVVGGPSVDLRIEGAVRLPGAVGACSSAECLAPDDQTFTASGVLDLNAMSPARGSPDRVDARLTGDFQSLSLDEDAVLGISRGQALAGTAVVAGFLLAFKSALAFFTRHKRAALDNPRVREIHGIILGHPGLSFNALMRRAGTGTGNLRGHLRRLIAEGHVVGHRYRNTVRYFENHGRYDSVWRTHAVLHDATRRRLHEWILARPGSTQGQVLAAANQWGVPRSTAQDGLRALVQAGLLAGERHGRFVCDRAVPSVVA